MDIPSNIKSMVASMTLEQKIGQKIMLDFMHWNGQNMTAPNDDVKSLIVDNNIGGVILFSNNLKDPDQSNTLTSWFASIQTKPETRLFLGTDEEGGDVFRLPRRYYASFPGNMALGAAVYGGASPSLAYSQGKQLAQDLKTLNINIAFAPVADVNTNANNPVINVRSFSAHWPIVRDLAEQMAAGIRSEKVMTTYKHFPGHGGAWSDSHLTLPLITRNRQDAFTIDIAPYADAIGKGAAPDLVLTAHIQYPSLDSTKIKATKTGEMIIIPATMSREIQTVILRNQLGFSGVTVSDALNMGAIANYFTEEDAIAKVFAAGVDISLMPIGIYSTGDMALLPKFIQTVVDKVKSGAISEADINASVERILRLKSAFDLASAGISMAQAQPGGAGADPFTLEQEIADKSVTLLRNNTGELPIRNTQKKFFIFTPWNEQGEGIAQPLIANGYSVTYAKQGGITDAQRDAYIAACDVFVMGTMVANLNPDDPDIDATSKLMLKAQNELNKTVVHVSLRAPYDIVSYYDVRNCLVTYARYGFEGDAYWGGPSMKTLGEILIGKRKPVGKLPVALYWSYDNNLNEGIFASPYYAGFGLTY